LRRPFESAVELARLLAQHEVDRRHAANDNGGEVPAA
jgi:hypothetical protein